MKLSKREIELIEGMIEVQRYHALTASKMPNPMGAKQYTWDMERVKLLERVLKESEVE